MPRSAARGAREQEVALLLARLPGRLSRGEAGLDGNPALPPVRAARQEAPGEGRRGGEGQKGRARPIVEIRVVAPGAQITPGEGEIAEKQIPHPDPEYRGSG